MTRWRSHLLPSAPVLVATELLVLVVAASAAFSGLIWWQALLLAAVLGGLCLLPVRGRALLDWAATAASFRLARSAPEPHIVNSSTADSTPLGLVWDGGSVCSVLEVVPARGAVTRLTRDEIHDDHPLPLAALAESLSQNDIELAGLDVVAHGRRIAPDSAVAAVYDELVGPLPATADRTVWLVLRFDAAAQLQAVERRGGGSDGAARTLGIATQRIARRLSVLGTATRILSAAEIRCARDSIAGGGPASAPRQWGHVPVPDGRNTGHSIDPRMVTTEALTALWSTRTLATTVTVRIRPDAGKVRIGGSCRFVTADLPDRPPLPGLAPTTGRDADALSSHLPGSPRHLDSLTAFALADPTRLESLTLPSAGSGQLIGSDADGRGVAVRVVGPDVGQVEVAGEPYLVQQVVLRAIATGARIAVHSARPQHWRQLIGSVGDPGLLALTDDVPSTVTAVVFDGIDPLPLPPAVTAICVRESAPTGAATVSIVQPGGYGSRIVLWAEGTRSDLTLVSTTAESAFLGRPRTAPEPVPAR